MCLTTSGRFQSLVINRERRGRFSNFEGPVSNFPGGGNAAAPNIHPSNMVIALNSFCFQVEIFDAITHLTVK